MRILEKPVKNAGDYSKITPTRHYLSEEAHRDWLKMPITMQMGNIGSEVSRSLKWMEKKNQARADKAIDRALELFDFTIEANRGKPARLREILKAREEFCDYFFGGNSYHTDPGQMQKYYDGFVMMERLRPVASQLASLSGYNGHTFRR